MVMRTASLVLALACVASGLYAGDGVIVVEPGSIKIKNPEGVVEFQELKIRSKDKSEFLVKKATSSAKLLNVTGSVGFHTKACNLLVYLSSTMKPGHYTDVLEIEFQDKNLAPLRVPVTIDVTPKKGE